MRSDLLTYLDAELSKVLAESDVTKTIDPQKVFDSKSLLRGLGISKDALPAQWLKDDPVGNAVSCHIHKGNKSYRVQAARKTLKGFKGHYEVILVEEVQPSPPFNPFETNTGSRTVTIFRDLLGW